jgi:cell wall-associated NlpC family hydrolase
MLFFKLKTSQKLILALFFGAVFLSSCSSSKKVAVSTTKKPTESLPKDHHERKEKTPEPSEETFEDEAFTTTKREAVPANNVDKVISTARTFIGTPYKYGGMTRSGMDCSGLLINSFTVIKVNLPRSSEAQSKVGTQVKMNDLKPGDLVFFATGNKKNEITHVGLVTDVKDRDNVKFIHASSKLGVVETNLFAEYYQKRFRVARRVIE